MISIERVTHGHYHAVASQLARSKIPVRSTLQEIEEALIYVAYAVEKYGDGYAPVLNRLEREFEAARL